MFITIFSWKEIQNIRFPMWTLWTACWPNSVVVPVHYNSIQVFLQKIHKRKPHAIPWGKKQNMLLSEMLYDIAKCADFGNDHWQNSYLGSYCSGYRNGKYDKNLFILGVKMILSKAHKTGMFLVSELLKFLASPQSTVSAQSEKFNLHLHKRKTKVQGK